jgi:hypothetical protein
MTMIKKYVKAGLSAACVLLLGVGMPSCNKAFDNPLDPQEGDNLQGVSLQQRRVLLVMIDGARGAALRNAAAPNLITIADNSIYSTDALGDYERPDFSFTNENAWANLLTGVSQTKHRITDDLTNSQLAQYPTIFTRLKEVMPNTRTVAFTSSNQLKNVFLTDATQSQVLANDLAVKTAALNEIGTSNTQLITAHFNGTQLAGDQFGYEVNRPEYISALRTLDGYIGELRNALAARPSNEKWLMVIASTNGGPSTESRNDITAYGDTKRNTFIFFYNPKFTILPLEKPADSRGAGTFFGTTPFLYGNASGTNTGVNIVVQNAPGETNQNALEIGDGPFVVEAKVKIFPKPGTNSYAYNNMPFFSKASRRVNAATDAGWSFFRLSNNNIQCWLRTNGGSGDPANQRSFEFTVRNHADSNWHTLGMKVIKDGTAWTVTTYWDGSPATSSTQTIANGERFTTTAPMRFGFNDASFSSDVINMSIADVRVWKANIPDNIIYQYSCLPGLPPSSHPFRNQLVGFWSCRNQSGSATEIVDETGNGRNGLVNRTGSGVITWRGFREVNGAICPEPDTEYFRKVPNSTDVAYQIYRWMGVNRTSNWGLDGKIWVSNYDGL